MFSLKFADIILLGSSVELVWEMSWKAYARDRATTTQATDTLRFTVLAMQAFLNLTVNTFGSTL